MKNLPRKAAPVIFLFLLSFLASPPDSPMLGNWITPDQSIVQVHTCEGDHLCVRIATIARKDVPRVDAQNPDPALRTRPFCGLEIGTGFTQDGPEAAKGGKIYDPDSGKTYSAQMQGSGDTLHLRGFIGVSLLGRTETWHRAPNTLPPCQ